MILVQSRHRKVSFWSLSERFELMRDRDRYSRWALAGAALVLIGTVDYAVMASKLLRGEVIRPPLVLPPGFGPFAGAFEELLGLAWILAGPACIALGLLARRELKRRPVMRGKLMAQVVIAAGSLATVSTLLIIAIAAVI